MKSIEQLIRDAINEDINSLGDYSSLSCIKINEIGKCKLLVKDSGIIAGIEIAKKVFEIIDPSINFKQLKKDGDNVQSGDIAFVVSGHVHSLLKGERTALNYMQRMSGIATKTKEYCELISHTKCSILDTRKTTPNNRLFEKMAVKIGGGQNHRFGLYDMIMLKDNHIDFAGGIPQAIIKTNNYLKDNNLNLKIEIEVRDLNELEEVLNIGKIHRIMLDNFNISDTVTALKGINGKYETESSGGINKETITSYAETGVDFISIGALTHQIASLDLSLKAF